MHRPVVVPGEVARARPLDLDDPGAEVGELPGGERRRHRLLQRDHHDADQRELRRQRVLLRGRDRVVVQHRNSVARQACRPHLGQAGPPARRLFRPTPGSLPWSGRAGPGAGPVQPGMAAAYGRTS